MTDAQRTGFIEEVAPLSVLLENTWVPARSKDYSSDTAELILVLRDNREGVSWHRVRVGLTEEP